MSAVQPLPQDKVRTASTSSKLSMEDGLHPEEMPVPAAQQASIYGIIAFEIPLLMRLALPLVVSNLISSVPQLLNLLFIGPLGTEYVAAASLAIMYSNITAVSVLVGMSTALDTLLSQANGAKQYHLVGIYVQRGLLFLSVLLIPCLLLSIFAEDILLLLGQHPDIAQYAGSYVRWLSLGYLPLTWNIVLLKYLQIQGIVDFTMYSSLACMVVNTSTCYLLIEVAEVGFIGAALAVAVQRWVSFAFTVGWILYFGIHKKTWPRPEGEERLFFGFHRAALQRWSQLCSLATSSCLQICLEWWAFEVLCIFAGILGTSELAAYNIVLSILSTLYMIPMGLAEAVTIRCGNLLGANHPLLARNSCYLGMGLCLLVTTLDVGLLLIFREQISNGFSKDPEVLKYVIPMMFISIAAHIFDGCVATLQGIVKGCGEQSTAAKYNLVMYYLLGIPLGLFLGFPCGLGVLGLWGGLTLAIACNFAVFTRFVYKFNWTAQAQAAQKRLQEEGDAQVAEEASSLGEEHIHLLA